MREMNGMSAKTAAFSKTNEFPLRRGIAVAGNLVADVVKNIDRYPGIGMLSSIRSVSRGVGGSVPNVGIDLKRIDPFLPVSGVGCVGSDEYGRFLMDELHRAGMDTSRIRTLDNVPTSFSDVMSLPGGERTFFHARGANALFSPSDAEADKLDCDIMHIAYILLLDRFDAPDPEYGTVMARYLRSVQEKGIRTSVDMVTDSGMDYAKTVRPALKYCDYLIVNEIECCSAWGLSARDENGLLKVSAVRKAMEMSLAEGVKRKVVVHAREGGFCLSRDRFFFSPSLCLPAGAIEGSVGAGDAFCAGTLYGIYGGWDDEKTLSFACACAACSLTKADAVSGMRGRDEVWRFAEKYPPGKPAFAPE